MEEDWNLLLRFLPPGWEALAAESGALKGLRKDKTPENLLRVLLLHLGSGHSLRETAVRSRRAGLSDLSAVALMKRLRKSVPWLHALCRALFEERGVGLASSGGIEVRMVDTTTVKESGRTGSLWRVHYCIRLPSLICDHFQVTAERVVGTGESFTRFPVCEGDCIMGDRGYSTAAGVAHVARSGGHVTVHVNTGALRFKQPGGNHFDLLEAVAALDRTGSAGSWDGATVGNGSTASVVGRICAIRKSDAAIEMAHRRLHKEARRRGQTLKPQTLELARYVIVFTTFPRADFTPEAVLDWVRLRWQVERVFKRFKSIAQLGNLPKHDDASARAWLYGKLFTALLTEKLIAHASTVSPWGYDLPALLHGQPMAGIQVHPQSGQANN